MTTERVVEFGPGRRLVGVLTSGAPSPTGVSASLAVLFVNAGIVHRVGPNRLHVHLARQLAAAGVTGFRYDLPGLGDSDTVAGTGDVHRDQISATMAAMTAVERVSGCDQFVIFGICAGADHAFRTLMDDERIYGAIMVDPTRVFATMRHRMLSSLAVLRRGMRPAVMKRLATEGLVATKSALHEALDPAPDPGAPMLLDPEADSPEWQIARDTFQSLARRHGRCLFIMTHHSARVYTYDEQLRDAFPGIVGFDRTVHSLRCPTADHTFTREQDRNMLAREILAWLSPLTTPGLS